LKAKWVGHALVYADLGYIVKGRIMGKPIKLGCIELFVEIRIALKVVRTIEGQRV